MKLIAKSYNQPQNHQQNKYNANQLKPKSLGIFHHHGWTIGWTSPLCPPLLYRPHPHSFFPVPDEEQHVGMPLETLGKISS
jgi:hypothetical protein